MNEKNKQILDAIKGQLIVSCQALPSEPLHSSYIMSRMAYAAYLGGSKYVKNILTSYSWQIVPTLKKACMQPKLALT